jgi:hypothetical protein
MTRRRHLRFRRRLAARTGSERCGWEGVLGRPTAGV